MSFFVSKPCLRVAETSVKPISEKNWCIPSAVHAENKSPTDNHAYMIHFLKPGLTKVLDSVYTDLDKFWNGQKLARIRLSSIRDPPLTLHSEVFERQN